MKINVKPKSQIVKFISEILLDKSNFWIIETQNVKTQFGEFQVPESHLKLLKKEIECFLSLISESKTIPESKLRSL